MTGVAHAIQIELGFRDPVRESSDFGVGVLAGDFSRKRFHILAQAWIGRDRKAQTKAKSIPSCAPTAVRSLRAGAGPRVLAVCSNLAFACQFRSLWLARVQSL